MTFVRFFAPCFALLVTILRATGVDLYLANFLDWQIHIVHLPSLPRLVTLAVDLYLIWAVFALVVLACMKPSLKRRLVIANGAFAVGIYPAVGGIVLVYAAFQMLSGTIAADHYGSGWAALACAVTLIAPFGVAICTIVQTEHQRRS